MPSQPREIRSSSPRPITIGNSQERGDLNIALGHAEVRNATVVKVLCYLSLMRATNLVGKTAKIFCSPPGMPPPQDYNSQDGQQSAHYLPGVITIKVSSQPLYGNYIWTWAPEGQLREDLHAL